MSDQKRKFPKKHISNSDKNENFGGFLLNLAFNMTMKSIYEVFLQI